MEHHRSVSSNAQPVMQDAYLLGVVACCTLRCRRPHLEDELPFIVTGIYHLISP